MNDEGLADARAANPFRLPRLHPGIGSLPAAPAGALAVAVVANTEKCFPLGLLADRLPYAPVVFVGVVDERSHDQLLHRHRWRIREKDPALRQLLVTEPAHHGSGLGCAFPMERERLLPGAAGKIHRVLGVPLVEHLPREVAERLPGREPRSDVRDPFIRRRQVMRCHADRPLLRFRNLLPVRVAQLLEYTGGFLSLGLEVSGECFSLSSHGVLLGVSLTLQSKRTPRNRQGARQSSSRPRPGERCHALADVLDFHKIINTEESAAASRPSTPRCKPYRAYGMSVALSRLGFPTQRSRQAHFGASANAGPAVIGSPFQGPISLRDLAQAARED